MNSDLAALQISERELEQLCGFEISDLFIGGVFGGVCRSSVFRQRRRLLLFVLTELLVFCLVCGFALPIARLLTRNAAAGITDAAAIFRFALLTVGIAGFIMLGWNLYLWLAAKRLQILMHLLDEIDCYHEVIQAVDVLDRLEAVGQMPVNLLNRAEVLTALQATRDTLVAGLITEKILRDSRKFIARRYELLTNIEQNLTTLKAIEVSNQATQYSELLSEALKIGISVQQEVQRFCR